MASTEGGCPGSRWRDPKAWMVLSGVELAIILILATGLGYLATQQEGRPQEEARRGSSGQSSLAMVDSMNWTLQACRKEMKSLEANASVFRSEATRLSVRLQRQELENRVLQGEIAVLRNWTQNLQELNEHQKEILAHFVHHHKALSGRSIGHVGPPFLAPLVTITTIVHHL